MTDSITFIKSELPKFLKGDFVFDEENIKKYSKDASLLVVIPKLIIFPKDSSDIKALVKLVNDNKEKFPDLSITARSAGTCMAGGPLNESIILDLTKYMNGFSIDGNIATIVPGTFYRDFEKETKERGLVLPCYPASKNICALGGMIGNNCAGEMTLKHGKMEDYVMELKVILRDGNEYTVKPLSPEALSEKTKENTVEGEIYRELSRMIEENKEAIMSAKPKVSKNSAGYYLWNVWNGKEFNLCKLIVGSQGTLCIVTEAKLKLIPVSKHSKLFVVFMPNINKLGEAIEEVLPLGPESVESYDDTTMKFAMRYLPEIFSVMKAKTFFSLAISFIPEVFMVLTFGIPKLILLVEFSEKSDDEVMRKMHELQKKLARFKFKTRITKSDADAEKYWTIRRESFNLLRKHVRGRRTAPFIDDVVVSPKYLPEFLPKIRKILDDYKMLYTIAGHAGNGNFHIIPLMDMREEGSARIISEVSDKVFDLVKEYKGSITGEHNDGIIRTPYLDKMFSAEILSLFAKTKHIFDPNNMFNPGKKVGCTKKYMLDHLSKE